MQTHAYRGKTKQNKIKQKTGNVYAVMDIALATTTQERQPASTVDSAISNNSGCSSIQKEKLNIRNY